MAHLEIHNIGKRFGGFVALDDICLAAERGEFVVLLGPSGCGKTTLLRVIAGLEAQDGGRLLHAWRDISHAPPAQRDYGIVFQSYALFPNLSVGQNVAYGLSGGGRAAFAQRVDEMLSLVGLPGTEARYPAQLSGGQQQRVALARALATRPDLLLLDEPLSALDAIERVRLRGEIRRLQQRLGVTAIMVTHDQEEALAMADRIVVMKAGRIQQVGTPAQIYDAPHNPFVAEFIGRSNLVEAQAVDAAQVRLYGAVVDSRPDLPALVPGRRYRCSLRPEDIHLVDNDSRATNSFHARTDKCEFLGAYTLLTLSLQGHDGHDGAPLLAQVPRQALDGRRLQPGAVVRVGIAPGRLLALAEAAA